MKKISKRTRITKFTPIFVFYEKVTEALRKCFGFDFHLFFLYFIFKENRDYSYCKQLVLYGADEDGKAGRDEKKNRKLSGVGMRIQ